MVSCNRNNAEKEKRRREREKGKSLAANNYHADCFENGWRGIGNKDSRVATQAKRGGVRADWMRRLVEEEEDPGPFYRPMLMRVEV